MRKTVSDIQLRINTEFVSFLLFANQVSVTEIAAEARISRSTASKVLRNYRHVGAEKRTAVLKVLARRLRRDASALCLGRAAA